nr:hypothetical protein [Tanacetum cinerariifolium]
MALMFADTHNMIAYLTKSDASEGFDQIIDFLNASAIQQEQAGKEEADRFGLAFPSLNPILGVGTTSIGSFVSAGSTPQMSPCASPISIDRHSSAAGKSFIFAGRPVSAGRPTGSVGRHVFAGNPTGSAGRPSGFATRTPIPAGRILGMLPSNTLSKRFPRASNVENLDIHDGLKIFNCLKSGTKWILKNKRNARRIVCRNKARLVAQGHRQEEGIYYTDVFAPVARIEAIRLFLAFASFIGFMVYQMDVKSAFLYGKIAEEVYVTQPRGFEDPDHPKKFYKVVKALYGLHQAPRAWYKRLSTFLLKHGYRRGTINKTLFIKKDSKDIMLVQVYVDDIICGFTRKDWCEEFETLMHNNSKLASTPFEPQKIKEKNVPDEPISVHLYKSMIGCLMYLTATRPDIMFAVCAAARHQVTPKTSNLVSLKQIFKYLTAYPKKSTTAGCQFLGRRLISWQCKKQTIIATSFCEAEYVAAASCCGQ